MIDESAHKVFDYGMKNWHGFCTHKCSHCSRQLDIYYCESRLYLVRCKHCKIVSLVEAGNPNEAAEKESRHTEPENKALTVEQLRRMGGQPIWVEQKDTYYKCGWALVTSGKDIIASNGECNFEKANYGKTWLAYARKPEAGEKG